MPKGVYTAVWSVAGTQSASGAFAFDVDPARAAPKTVSSATAVFALKPVKNVLLDWVPWISIMVLVGVLMLRFVVVGPSLRRISDSSTRDEVAGSTDRRLARLAAVALAVLIPATIVQLAFEAGGSTFAYSKIWTAFGADGAGHVALFSLIVIVAAGILLIPAAIVPRRYGSRLKTVMLAALVLGLIEMLCRVVPTAIPPDKPRTYFGDLFTYGHIVGAAIWIGGLAGLVALAIGQAVPGRVRAQYWPTAIRRFSTIAMGCVGVVVLSGLWLSWVHIGGVSQLGTTLYGRTVLVKVIGVSVLVALGGLNHIWLRPQLEARRASGDDHGIVHLVGNHFRAVVAVEVLLGLGILFAVPYLSGSARNQAFQAKAADISQTAKVGATTVRLTPSGLQPGLTNYDVAVPGATAKTVQLSFASDKLGIPPQVVSADQVGPGRYRASGFYTPIVGDWQVRVNLAGVAQPASFDLPIKAAAPKLPKAPAPRITAGTWVQGIAEVAVVLLALFGAHRLGQLRTRRRVRQATATLPPTSDELALTPS